MSGRQQLVPADHPVEEAAEEAAEGADLLRQLVGSPVQEPPSVAQPLLHGVVTGQLVAIADAGLTPLVVVSSLQPGARALRARTVVDLQDVHIGQQVVLAFEQGDAERPIVMGVLRSEDFNWPIAAQPEHAEVAVDGDSLIVSARQRLVLRCGKASITLTRAGKVLIDGAYVQSRSTGMNRVKGGSVQIN